jgi:hypothetical protein
MRICIRLVWGLSWGVAVDERAVSYTGINSDRVNYTLANGDVISNSVYGALDLKDGGILWQTAMPQNMSSVVAPVVVNNIVLTGITGFWSEDSFTTTGRGSFVALNKITGEILREVSLDVAFRENFAAVHDCVMFGTGYGRSGARDNGTFNVWKLNATGHHGGEPQDQGSKQEARKRDVEKQKMALDKKIRELETEIERLREL